MTSTLCSGYECVEEATAAAADIVQNADSGTADQKPLTQVLSTVTVPGLPHNTDNSEHNVVVNSGVAVDLSLDLTQQGGKLDNIISINDDGYDTQESTDDFTPEPLENEKYPFYFGSFVKDENTVKYDISRDADNQKREKDARDWIVKSLLFIGTASVALSTIHESYVEYCEGNGTEPLQLSQLKNLLKDTFPRAALQNKEVNGVEQCITVGLQLLKNSGVNQTELGQGIKVEVPENDLSHNLREESSDQGYNSDNSQTEEHNLINTSQNESSSVFDSQYDDIKSEQEDSSIRVPQEDSSSHVPQLFFGGRSAGNRFIEPFYAAEAEQVGKIREHRRAAQRYQQEVENRRTSFENVNQMSDDKSTIIADEVESCKGAAKRLSHVITWMKDNGHTKILLRDFAHSASCGVAKCSPFCMMFRRVRRHVVSAKHQCVLLRLYSLLLRLHVNSCNNDNCGLQACPTLRANKSVKRSASEGVTTFAKRPSPGPMIQSKRIAPNPLLVPRPSSNNTANQVVVVYAIPANRLEGASIGN